MGVPGTACCKLLCPGFRLLCFTVVNYRESPARGRYSQLYSVVGSSDAAVRCQHCGSLFGCACARARSTPSRTCCSTSGWTATAGHSFTIDEVPRCRRESLSASRCIGLSAGWLGSRVVSVLDSGAVGPGFKSQPRRCRVTVLGKLLTPIVPLFTKQRNW